MFALMRCFGGWGMFHVHVTREILVHRLPALGDSGWDPMRNQDSVANMQSRAEPNRPRTTILTMMLSLLRHAYSALLVMFSPSSNVDGLHMIS
jgi:hypothetical protein